MEPVFQIRAVAIVTDVDIHEIQERRLVRPWIQGERPDKDEGNEVEPRAAHRGQDRVHQDGFGLRATIVGATPYPGIAPGTVIRQSPSGGFQIALGESISMEVSR